MKQAIEQLTEAANKVRGDNEYGFTSVCVEVDVTSSGTTARFKVWHKNRYHHGETLDEAIKAALDWSPKVEALKEAAELRAKADEIEASVAQQ